jgi:membrane fusion protein (multidrug efflux system)
MLSLKVPAIIACSCVVIACGGKKKDPKASGGQTPIVDVIVAGYTEITNTVEANGTVLANEFVELRPEVSGRLTYLQVAEGKYVEAGTVIARVNDADLQAQLGKTKVQLDLAEKTEVRLHKLLDISGVNQADYDAAINTVNGLKADLGYTQAMIDKTVIRAPFSGTIGLRQVSPGAYVSSATVIATMQQLHQLKIDFTIPEQYGNLVKTGGTVDVVIDGTDNARHKARIIAIEPQANALTRNLKVRALLPNAGHANPGAFVKVYVGEGAAQKAILVPSNVIIPSDKNKQVVLVRKGKAFFADIETGLRQASFVAVTKGINQGDTIVVNGVMFATNNDPVKVRSVKNLNSLADTTAGK